MDNYKSLLMETISKNDLVSKPAKIKRAGKLKEDLLPDEVYDTLVRKSKKTYTIGVYSTLPGPGWHYEINTEYGVYTKVPDDEGFIAHWFLQGLPQESEEDVERVAKRIITQYDCKEVSLDEYKRIVNGKNESLKEDVDKKNIFSDIKNRLKEMVEEANGRPFEFEAEFPLKYKNKFFNDILDEYNILDYDIMESSTSNSENGGKWYYFYGVLHPFSSMYDDNGAEWGYKYESLKEDTVKTSDGKWTNKGKEGTHGKFKTKKAADAQRKAMFANGYRESLKERYADDAVVLTASLRKKLNNICQKYSGFRLPEQIAPMWKEFYDLGIEVLIQGYPTDTAPGAKSWTVPFTLNGETVENSRFVYSVYEGSEGLRNDYNMYFS